MADSMHLLTRSRRIDTTDRLDFVRMMALDLCADEIIPKAVEGSIAEVGVYRGDFALKINAAFPDKKFYLFDTFEGFDSRDTQIDRQNNYSTGDQDFSRTSVEYVISRMKHPSNCVIRKGYFPETAAGLENETYSFVSIDVDLYKPILEGLSYFYNRLSEGGYIFIHDYNNDSYKGVKDAVRQFCTQENISYFPLPDGGGSAVITK